jgi:hypothetical protein
MASRPWSPDPDGDEARQVGPPGKWIDFSETGRRIAPPNQCWDETPDGTREWFWDDATKTTWEWWYRKDGTWKKRGSWASPEWRAEDARLKAEAAEQKKAWGTLALAVIEYVTPGSGGSGHSGSF